MRGTHEKPLQHKDHILVPSDPEQAARGSHDPDPVRADFRVASPGRADENRVCGFRSKVH